MKSPSLSDSISALEQELATLRTQLTARGAPPEVPHTAISNIDGWHVLLVSGNDHLYLGERRNEVEARDFCVRLDTWLASHWPAPAPAVACASCEQPITDPSPWCRSCLAEGGGWW